MLDLHSKLKFCSVESTADLWCDSYESDLKLVSGALENEFEDRLETFSEGARRTIIGVTAKAVSDYVRYRKSSIASMRALAEEAEVWLFMNNLDTAKEPFLGSFAWVCMILGRDVNKGRAAIKLLKVGDLPKVDRGKDDDSRSR
jgi:predicted transcriptional regulator